MTKNRGNANKKYLYHGTSPKTIDNICVQNFDFRMSGKNATMFGKGSYFASTALYSHKYTSKDFNGNLSMFVAQVLVGKFTQVLFIIKNFYNFFDKKDSKLFLNGSTFYKNLSKYW